MGRWLVPSLADLLFVALFLWLFAGSGGPHSLLVDGDIGWHIRAGEFILDGGAVPTTDLFTFTKPGAPWFAWEWLSDILFALAHRALLLKGVVVLAGVVLAAWPIVVLRHALWRGASVWTGLAFTLLSVGAASIHYLARPHVFTLFFTAVSAWILSVDRHKPSKQLWWLLPLTVLWTNLHGGFGIVVALSALACAGSAIEAWVGAGRWGRAARYACLALGCAAASVINPYGIELHRHISAYLRSDWIRSVVQEFHAPDFRSESLLQFEALLMVALLLTGILIARRRYVEALWIVAFAHLALTSARHVPVFAIVAAPVAAGLVTSLLTARPVRGRAGSLESTLEAIAEDLRPAFQRISIWPVLALAAIILTGAGIRWPQDFPSSHFPVSIARANAGMISAGRVLTVDQWADYLLYSYYPRQRVFADGRSDFLGPGLGNEYIRLMQGDYRWSSILERYGVDVVLAPVEWPLSTILKSSPHWRVAADDGRAILFEKRRTTGIPR